VPPTPSRTKTDASASIDARPAHPAPSARARAFTFAKWTLACFLLGVVLWKLPLADLATRLARIRASHVLLLGTIATVQFSLSVVRWWRLLHRLGERVSYKSAFGDAAVGILYNFLLPGSVGGDVVRALRMRSRVHVPHHAWATSIFERIVGLFAMAATGSAAVAIGLDATVDLPQWLRYATYGLTAALLAAFVFASLPFRLLVRFIGSHLPAVARVDIAGIGEDLSGPLTKLSIRAETFAWSLVYQAVNLVFVAACAAALGAPGHERAIVIGVPMIYVLSLAPITVGGLGLREGLYVGILGALGMPGEVALGLSAAFVVANVLFSGVGGLFLVLDQPPAKAAPGAPP